MIDTLQSYIQKHINTQTHSHSTQHNTQKHKQPETDSSKASNTPPEHQSTHPHFACTNLRISASDTLTAISRLNFRSKPPLPPIVFRILRSAAGVICALCAAGKCRSCAVVSAQFHDLNSADEGPTQRGSRLSSRRGW